MKIRLKKFLSLFFTLVICLKYLVVVHIVGNIPQNLCLIVPKLPFSLFQSLHTYSMCEVLFIFFYLMFFVLKICY